MTNSSVIIPSSTDERNRIQSAIKEISNSLTRIEAERDLIKETLKLLEDEFELPKKYMRKVAVTYHRQNLNQVKEEFSDIEEIYTAIAP